VKLEGRTVLSDEERQRLAAIKLLKKAQGFQHHHPKYDELLNDRSELVRLEVLSWAAEDIIGLKEEPLRSVLSKGSVTERKYALLILARNGCIDRETVYRTDLGRGKQSDIWKSACYYALDQTLTNALDLFKHVRDKDLGNASLAVNLSASVMNAIHRVMFSDVIKVLLETDATTARLKPSLIKAKSRMSVRSSWKSIQEHSMTPDVVWRFFS
jgi:hypothetical protein